jgi:hypothetical protein
MIVQRALFSKLLRALVTRVGALFVICERVCDGNYGKTKTRDEVRSTSVVRLNS